MKVFISKMANPVSKSFVKLELNRLGIDYLSIEAGIIRLPDHITDEQLGMVLVAMQPFSFEPANDFYINHMETTCGFRGGPGFLSGALLL